MAKRFKCNICNKKFTDSYNLSSHKYIHTTETPFSCPLCPYKGKTKKYLARHTKQIHREKSDKHKCSVCGKLFLHLSGLKVHSMVHTGEKPHSCNVCGKTFRVTYSLNSHMLIHKNEKPFECSFCEYACRDSSTLRKHQNKHMGLEKIYQCKICDKGYKSRAALKIHISEFHLDVDVRRFPCSRCDRLFKTNAHRNHHIELIHKRSLVCNCPICGRRLMNKNNLASHMRTHLNDRPFRCTQPGCIIAFKDKNSLKKHSVIHNPDLHYACAHCGRKFARKTHVQRHERVMHLERGRNVECDYCGSKFYSKNYLIKHIQTKHVHKHKFKYICDICGLVTHNKPSIVMHLKYGHSNDNDLQCKICDTKRVYKRHLYLKLHYWNTHSIRYKITRPGANTSAARRKKAEKSVEVKVEPIEADSYEEMELMDIDKEENEDDINEDESLDYSKRVLSEDIADSVLKARARTNEVDFDEFFIRHVFAKQQGKPEKKIDGVNEQQNEYVKKKIKKIIARTEKLEKARADKEKRREEAIERRDKEAEEAKMRERREKEELANLRRVREIYNERMNAAIAKERAKKEQVKIKYLKKVTDSSKNNSEDPKSIAIDESPSIDATIEAIDKCKVNNVTENIITNDIQDDSINKIDNNHVKDTANCDRHDTTNKNRDTISNNDDIPSDDENNKNNDDIPNDDEAYDQPLLQRRVKSKNCQIDSDNTDNNDSGKGRRMEFKTFQCYICFKLYQTKEDLIDHCQIHFDICHEKTLTKCPICNHVSPRSIAQHMKRKHNVTIKIPFNKLQKNKEIASKYCYDINGTVVEVIPSIRILNKTASDNIDKRRRDIKDKSIARPKLVKIGDEWIVDKEVIGIQFDEIPELTDRELHKLKVSDNDFDRLGQLSYLAKRKGLKMMFPCFVCDKICQNFSALKLHKRKHDDNPKPFKRKIYKRDRVDKETVEVKLNKANRTALPKPITNKHKCDEKLKEFFESNIRGGDIEFWQFLKIYNKMNKERINDFSDLETRTDFGNHLDYYKDVELANDKAIVDASSDES